MKLMLLISCLAICVLEATLAQATSGDMQSPMSEAYRYTSASGDNRAKETIFMAYDFANDHVMLSSRTLGRDSFQTVALILTPQGTVVSATLESKTSPDGEVLQKSRIRRENETVYVDNTHGRKSNARSIIVPEGQELAVDVSLLYLMRQFPFNTGKGWRVFMVDFSGQSVTVSISNKGTDLVTVPAGEFPCYRMEVLISVAFLNATITYWLTKSPPHFLVKHIGKKGPFTKTYTTVLDSIESPNPQMTKQPPEREIVPAAR
jgi:hypothetical protein